MTILRKSPGEDTLFVDELDVQNDEEESEGEQVTRDRIIYEESEREEDEGGIHRMADEGVGAICNQHRGSARFGDDAETASVMREYSGGSEEHASHDKSGGYDILRAEGLTDRMEKGEVSEYEELRRDERDSER